MCFIKTWQYICDHNSGKSWWILTTFTYLETGMNALCKWAIYLIILHVMQIWRHCHFHDIDELRQRLLHVWQGIHTCTPWAIKRGQLIFVWNFVKINWFNAVFIVKFLNERYIWRYELHPPHLINVATLPSESRNAINVRKQNFSF